ncbi:MAG: RdgB/HAM1 family non-canonical purine NTP pyrophosphatase [Bacteroidota bacterium]|nr:RdgB/HAM1 family non-canonical purine NTP pyrophosphatase [Bacteroidota bacterium]MDP4212758.1 RdgB/HAM1 family non-canonical purine NTP pyrophosphatase [Bacteroidota bacterium]MDP4249337.1 RdgB/HAM1 family non-canonical purine NTP pyrophosphatase [Bacteroidota bacterium]
MKLIFATHNQHKVEEIQSAIGNQLKIISLREAGISQEIPEPHDTLRENALEKSRTIYLLSNGEDCFSEDTGLEVDSLRGEPGVRSARYAGEPVSFSRNIDKLLANMSHSTDRNARFRTVISLILNDQEYFFEGTCNGQILAERRGVGGFGYDPVFVPDGAAKSFSEMTMEEKNLFSHRKKAADKMILFLNQKILNT